MNKTGATDLAGFTHPGRSTPRVEFLSRPITDILRRSYLVSEQSPASSHSAPIQALDYCTTGQPLKSSTFFYIFSSFFKGFQPAQPLVSVQPDEHKFCGNFRKKSAAGCSPAADSFPIINNQIRTSSYLRLPRPSFSPCSSAAGQLVSGWTTWKWSPPHPQPSSCLCSPSTEAGLTGMALTASTQA